MADVAAKLAELVAHSPIVGAAAQHIARVLRTDREEYLLLAIASGAQCLLVRARQTYRSFLVGALWR